MKFKLFKCLKFLFMLSLAVNSSNLFANINYIDFTKIKFSKKILPQVDFLRHNDSLYDQWVHDWNYDIPQKKVIETLTSLYKEVDKMPEKNLETELLLGDIGHYIYNLNIEAFYQKAEDHYLLAKNIAPDDYRVYWFLGNHYALSDNVASAVQEFRVAMQYLPKPTVSYLFWADYARACSYANMPGTAYYASNMASKIAGRRIFLEDQIMSTNRTALKSVHSDTVVDGKEMWLVNGKQGKKLLFFNRLLGTRLLADSTWELQISDFRNWFSYISFKPQPATGKNGEKIGYSILFLTQVPEKRQTLQRFLDSLTAKSTKKTRINFEVGGIKNCIGYEIKDPDIYPQFGGSHSYAIAIQRDQPAFPGMLLETPLELQAGSKNDVTYYLSPARFTRINTRLYYYILLNSCESIHDESLAVFKELIENITLE